MRQLVLFLLCQLGHTEIQTALGHLSCSGLFARLCNRSKAWPGTKRGTLHAAQRCQHCKAMSVPSILMYSSSAEIPF